jgi:hypothetical protein
MSGGFPLPFPASRTIDQSGRRGKSRFLVAAMYTPGYSDRAARLRASCDELGVPYVLFEIPHVHTSTSVRGAPDLSVTKPNFIKTLLGRYRRPILYVDADCVFRGYPALIDELLAQGTTFAAYNWAADEDNEAFYPVDVNHAGRVISGRFFRYSHRIGFHCDDQLICSGCVQLYGDLPAASAFLETWHRTIEKYPQAPDDQCLAFTFNNGGARLEGMKYRWLPKEYSRYSWWIFSKPVIDHPDVAGLTASGFRTIPSAPGLRHLYPERCTPTAPRFPDNAVVDIQERVLYELTERSLAWVGPLDLEAWIAEPLLPLTSLDIDAIGAASG